MHTTATSVAQSLGATIQGGINWTWAKGFTLRRAEQFVQWLNENGYEHRGVYPNGQEADVRFR